MQNKTTIQKNIKYKIVESSSEYEKAKEDLLGEKYVSVIAEKKRWWKKQFKIRKILSEDNVKKIVKNYSAAMMASYGLKFDENSLEIDNYIKSKRAGNIYKWTFLPDEHLFEMEYIFEDTIYTIHLDVVLKKSGKYEFIFFKEMILPITLDPSSLKAQSIRVNMWNDFRRYKSEIKRGFK